ncbi:ribosomal protein S31 [Mactra antiquata]
MNGSRLSKCMFCRILHSVSLNRRIHSIQKLRLSHGLLNKSCGSTFTTYQKLMKQNDDTSSGSSSSESDSSDSDSDVETGKSGNVTQENIVTDSLLARLRGEKSDSPKSHGTAESGMGSLLKALGKTAENTAEKPTSGKSGESVSALKDLLSDIVKGLSVLKKPEASSRKGGTKRGRETDRQMERKIFDDDHDVPFKAPVFRKSGIGLFDGKPLGIFSKKYMKTAKSDKPSLFDVVKEEEKSLLNYYPPENGFQEHIQWTKEGKLWTFPIDNEAGWEEEKNTSFEDHVFLENELVGFPRKGPIRHFMELVTVALSKNPYLTVQQKRENIEWYRDYFSMKQEILEERFGDDGIVLTREALEQ